MTSMKLGERSLFICSKYNIQFTEEEYAAMKILDKDEDKTNSFITPLEQLVKISNQLTAIETYQKNKNLSFILMNKIQSINYYIKEEMILCLFQQL